MTVEQDIPSVYILARFQVPTATNMKMAGLGSILYPLY
jgi:hypothetical protein